MQKNKKYEASQHDTSKSQLSHKGFGWYWIEWNLNYWTQNNDKNEMKEEMYKQLKIKRI
jgi:hypothetical protein